MDDASVMDAPQQDTFGKLLFDEPAEMTTTADETFRLRGYEHNRLVDAATPLLGLVIRVRRLADFNRVPELYQQVVDEVTDIDRELIEQGYERPTVVAYRYVLCAFIDEAVLGTDWGAHSVWSQQSLLSRFHNETWGGEKVFAILSRMEQEPDRYRDMLEFIYLTLCLGFEGRYKVMENGRDEYERIIAGLYRQIADLRDGEPPEQLGNALEHVTPARNRFRNGLPLWGIFGLFVGAMATVYTLYSIALDERIKDVLGVLAQLPK
ncbi:type IVB secretion system protein IcmH/DotU [Marinobacter nanhaiticus D15-8W]|uniref:DotU family type IV/VI secretion system protein n=1 Tax=Marinobacter nanhaiticus D15-8W TaxID=626887 RepID=N6X321_9GAMM|nr:type IVB secretion system protein IcmH/DotU [Marinobacter nanhaiticus]ENO15483.1 DotU family type IV/VI secretion system protein [Marinobacter nanhaiticus D15-8W]BES73667.1 type IVB secretion system protein IcmH/DotU [Marinobacter nanhaiticus D15-8W]